MDVRGEEVRKMLLRSVHNLIPGFPHFPLLNLDAQLNYLLNVSVHHWVGGEQ